MNQDIFKQLGASFPFEEVETKIQVTGKDNAGNPTGMVVFYLDSRTIQKRLDDVIGPLNWKNQYTAWHSNAQLCGIAIYNEERSEWVGKFDGAECSDIEPIKGGLSDSFKRAACMWGIGRYLYELDGIWVEVEQRGKGSYPKKNQMGKLKTAYDDAVKRIFGTGANPQTIGGNAPINAGSSGNNKTPANNQPNQPSSAPPVQQNQNGTPPQPAPQNTNPKQPPAPQTPEQSPPVATPTVFDFKIHGMKPSGKNSQLLELCNREGEIKSAFIKDDEEGIVRGAYLRNVQFEEKSGTYGKYSVITAYEIAA